jgi:Tfp pilus assembly protein PilV
MRKKRKNDGFSLTEVLLSVGILTVGLIFVAGVFPVGIHFATISTERTIAAVVADEAFAKIKLYGNVESTWLTRVPVDACVDFNDVQVTPLNPSEFAYPSTTDDISGKRFYWSALCKRRDFSPASPVQVTVFVYRKAGAGKSYWERAPLDPYQPLSTAVVPKPVWVLMSLGIKRNELMIQDFVLPDLVDETTFINGGCTIVDDQTGQRFQVLERYTSDPSIILLNSNWPFDPVVTPQRRFWVVPPPADGGRYPCIAMYRDEIQF